MKMIVFYLEKLFAVPLAILLICFAFLLRLLGLQLLGFLGRGLGRVLFTLGFRKKIVTDNVTLALGKEMPEEKRKLLIRSSILNSGLLFLELLRNFSVNRKILRREVVLSKEDQEKVHTILRSGKGAVFVTAHIANWELFAMSMAGAYGLPVCLVAKKMNNSLSQILIAWQRSRTGIEVIYSGGTIEKMKVALTQGKAIGFMVDQNTTGKKGIRVNFFGVPASSIRGLTRLIRETGAPVIPVCAFRQPNGTHKVTLLDPLPFLTDDSLPVDSIERLAREEWLNTQQVQNAVEKLVRMQPDQWLWIHRRWKADRKPLNTQICYLDNIESLPT